MGGKKPRFTKRTVFMVIVFVVGALVIGAAVLQKGGQRGTVQTGNDFLEAGDEPEGLPAADMEEGEVTEGKETKVTKVQGVSYPEEKIEEDMDIIYKKNLNPFFKNTIRDTLTSREGKNRAYSPVNLYFCMAMLTEMTDGQTRGQILDFLGQNSQEDIRKQSQLIWQKLYQDGEYSKCILGDSVWLNQDISFKKDVLKALSEYYYTEVYQGQMGKGMDQRIQRWVNDITGNRLKEAAGKMETKDDTVLVLLSAAHFYNQWLVPFSKESTKKDVFTNASGEKVTCDFMNGERCGGVNQTERFVSTSVEMENGSAMHLFLPEEGFTVADLLREDMDEILQIIGTPTGYGAENGQVTLSLPKFAISSSLDLIPVLKSNGVTDLFDSTAADFTKLLGKKQSQVYVDKVWQATKASVDEQGCSVDSFTEVGMKAGGIWPEKKFTVKCDHPFLFIISNNRLPVFAGVVNQMEE